MGGVFCAGHGGADLGKDSECARRIRLEEPVNIGEPVCEECALIQRPVAVERVFQQRGGRGGVGEFFAQNPGGLSEGESVRRIARECRAKVGDSAGEIAARQLRGSIRVRFPRGESPAGAEEKIADPAAQRRQERKREHDANERAQEHDDAEKQDHFFRAAALRGGGARFPKKHCGEPRQRGDEGGARENFHGVWSVRFRGGAGRGRLDGATSVCEEAGPVSTPPQFLFMAPFPPLVEPLEPRIAPASLIGKNTVIYTDADGDSVRLTISQPLFTSASVANAVLGFSSGANAVGTGTAAHEQLQKIDLTALGGVASGLSMSVAVTQKAAAGDGRADVGYINATGLDLGAVGIRGDLGRIDAGDADTGLALRALGVLSLGAKGIATQAAGGDLTSDIHGPVGIFNVAGDVDTARVNFLDATGHVATGSVGLLRIGGALKGGAADNTGFVSFSGTIGRAGIGSIVGGSGAGSGAVAGDYATLSGINAITIAGGITGGAGDASGEVSAARIHMLQVLSHGITGGSGGGSGLVQAVTLGRAGIAGDVKGGSGINSGEIFSGAAGSISIAGDLVGGTAGLGAVAADPNATPAVPARAEASGYSGVIEARALGRLQITGSVRGGDYVDNNHTASISGAVLVNGNIGSVVIGSRAHPGSLLGGTGFDSGALLAHGTLGPTVIFGDVAGADSTGGGAVVNSAYIQATHLPALFIGGDLRAGSDGGGGIDSSGAIRSGQEIGALFVGGSVLGKQNAVATTFNPAIISAVGQQELGINAKADIAIRSITIGGSATHAEILAGYSPDTAGQAVALGKAVNADASIGLVRIGKTISGSDIVAGAQRGSDGFFGDADDSRISGTGTSDRVDIISRISAVIIGGGAANTILPTDHFGIVAQNIGLVRAGGATVPLAPGPGNDMGAGRPVGGANSDLHAVEVA